MDAKYLAVFATLAVMLVAVTALATTDSVFAGGHGHKKKYGSGNSQATAQVNDCGNGPEKRDMVSGVTEVRYGATDVFCQNLNSQIQGEGNTAALAGSQGGDD